jgi:hypothetical protein
MTCKNATMTDRFDDQKGRSPDNTDNRVTALNTHNAVSLHACDKAAIGKAGDDKTIELEEIESSSGKWSVSGGRFDACNAAWKEVINPHVDDLDKIVRWVNGLTAAWKALHNV